MTTTQKILIALIATTALGTVAASADGWGGRGGHDRGHAMFERFDSDGDGAVTLEEALAVQAQQMAEFDANGDGTLTLEEYAALYAARMRSRMVDAFQRLDEDGDGIVTDAEMAAPVERMTSRADADGDGDVDADDRDARRAGMRGGGHHGDMHGGAGMGQHRN